MLVAVFGVAWLAGDLAARSEADETDARLRAVLNVAVTEFEEALEDAESRAAALARSERVQDAISREDGAALARLVGDREDVAFFVGDELVAGRADWLVRREAAVVRAGEAVGRVVVAVPLDRELLGQLAQAAGVTGGDRLLIAAGGRVAAGSGTKGDSIPAGGAGELRLNGDDYRYVSAPLLAGEQTRLLALASAEPIDEAAADTRRRVLLAVLATLALLALVALSVAQIVRGRPAYVGPMPEEEGRGRRARDAREDESAGQRMREAVALVGEALAATHDPEALLPVILESAIRATGAVGGRLLSGTEEVARAGEPDRGGVPLALRLGTEGEEDAGLLLLYPAAGRRFDPHENELAHWLAGQASIALDNARLHRVVKLQAVTDELTQLANRRRFTESLGLEVLRAERFGDPLTLVLADLDNFKRVNDRFGHQTGDEVLRRFAGILQENVREFDLTVRYGGEEFAVLLPETDLAGGERLARRLAAALERVPLAERHGQQISVTASFGVAAYPQASSAAELLARADRALYQAKAEGRNRIVCAEAGDGRGD